MNEAMHMSLRPFGQTVWRQRRALLKAKLFFFLSFANFSFSVFVSLEKRPGDGGAREKQKKKKTARLPADPALRLGSLFSRRPPPFCLAFG